MKVDCNALMGPIYEQVLPRLHAVTLAPALETIASVGVHQMGRRIYLRAPEHQSPPPATFDDLEAERWVNKVHLTLARPASESDWRPELVAAGLTLGRRLLAEATGLTPRQLQITIALQSAPNEVDPSIDFAVGVLHLYQLRSPADDARLYMEQFAQPVLTLTTTNETRPSRVDLARS